MDYILKQMDDLNADGVDFHPIMLKTDIGTPNMTILKSYTKNEFLNVNYYPKSCYTFWRMINGQKQYIKD